MRKSGFIVLLLVGLLVAMPAVAGVLGASNGSYELAFVGTKISAPKAAAENPFGGEVAALAVEISTEAGALQYCVAANADGTCESATVEVAGDGLGANAPYT